MPRPAWTDWLRLPEACPGVAKVAVADEAVLQRMANVFERMIADSRTMNAIQQQLALAAVEELLLLLYREAHDTRSGRDLTDPRIAEVTNELTAHYDRPQSIERLARQVCLSPSRLSHLYKQQTGETNVDTLHRLRLEKAAFLLQYTSMSVAETAERVGFASLNHFAKTFKRFYGASPSTYKGKR